MNLIQFIKDALTELEHIVWPTPNESKNYMFYTVGTIVVLGVFLAVLGLMLRSGLSLTRDQFPHNNVAEQSVSGETGATKQDVQDILEKVGVDSVTTEKVLSTGSIAPAPVATPSAQ